MAPSILSRTVRAATFKHRDQPNVRLAQGLVKRIEKDLHSANSLLGFVHKLLQRPSVGRDAERYSRIKLHSFGCQIQVPKGRRSVARGVSPWTTASSNNKAPEGRQTAASMGGHRPPIRQTRAAGLRQLDLASPPGVLPPPHDFIKSLLIQLNHNLLESI